MRTRRLILVVLIAGASGMLFATASLAMPMAYGLANAGQSRLDVSGRGALIRIEFRPGDDFIERSAGRGLSTTSVYPGNALPGNAVGHRRSIDRNPSFAGWTMGGPHGRIQLAFTPAGQISIDLRFDTPPPHHGVGRGFSAVPEPSAALVFGLCIVAVGVARSQRAQP